MLLVFLRAQCTQCLRACGVCETLTEVAMLHRVWAQCASSSAKQSVRALCSMAHASHSVDGLEYRPSRSEYDLSPLDEATRDAR